MSPVLVLDLLRDEVARFESDGVEPEELRLAVHVERFHAILALGVSP